MKNLFMSILIVASLSASSQIISSNVQVATNFRYNCAIYTPVNYTDTKKYPLLIFAHGMGEAGTDINKLYAQGLPNVLKSGFVPPFECIIVCPQATSYSVNPSWLPTILKDIQSRYSIDTTNIFLTGLSAGGWLCYGSLFNVSADYGKKFKGVIVLSGATQDINKANYDWIKISRVPVLSIVGGADLSYLEYNTTATNEINNRVPGDATQYVRSGLGHCCWTDVYNGTYKLPDGTTIWDWMKKLIGDQTQTPPPPVIQPTVVKEFTGTFQLMSDGTVRIKGN